jgi:hypothetical protein
LPCCILRKTVVQLPCTSAKSKLTEVEYLQGTWWKCFLPLPKNPYSAAC